MWCLAKSGRIQSLLSFGLAIALLAGCGGATPTPGPGAMTSAPTSAAASSPAAGPAGEVAEDLTFSGALSGHLTKGHRGDNYVCAGGNFVPSNPNTTGQLAVGPIVGDL